MDIQALQSNFARASQLMEMLSHPHRLHLLCVLLEGEHSVLELARLVGLSQPAMSHHLRKLRHADLVATRRDAQTIYYRLQGAETVAILEVLHRLYCDDHTPGPHKQKNPTKSGLSANGD